MSTASWGGGQGAGQGCGLAGCLSHPPKGQPSTRALLRPGHAGAPRTVRSRPQEGPGGSATSDFLAALPRYTSHAIQFTHLSARLTSFPQIHRGVQPLPQSSLEQSHHPQPPRRPPSPPQRLMDFLQIPPSRTFHVHGITRCACSCPASCRSACFPGASRPRRCVTPFKAALHPPRA